APEAAMVRERRLGYERLGDDFQRLVEARVGFLERQAKAGELVPAVAFADTEIEPAAGQQIEGRGLLGEQHRVVPGQHQDGGAEAQLPGAGAEPGQEVETGRDLAEPGEVMLDEKRAVIAERLGFDIVVDELAKTLTAVAVGTDAPRLGAA